MCDAIVCIQGCIYTFPIQCPINDLLAEIRFRLQSLLHPLHLVLCCAFRSGPCLKFTHAARRLQATITTTALTCKHFNDDGHLLLDDVLVREAGIAAVIGSRVVEQDVREVQISVHSHGHPAVLPHRLHGGERRLNGPVERSRIWAWNETWCWKKNSWKLLWSADH